MSEGDDNSRIVGGPSNLILVLEGHEAETESIAEWSEPLSGK